MPIDMASVYAKRFEGNPQLLQAAVLGQAPIPGLDPYTALRSLQLLKEAQMAQMAQMAQQPTQAPSLVDQAVAQPVPEMFGAVSEAAPESEGLAGMPVGEQGYAPGGIVSFANGGMDGDDEEDSSVDTSPGNPQLNAQSRVTMEALLQRVLADPKVQRMTPAQRKQFTIDFIKEQQEAGGESPYAAMREDISKSRGESAKDLERAQGIAMLEAAREALQPGGTARGLAAAAAAFGGSYGRAMQADRAMKRALAEREFNIADAERKERMGLYREARMAADAVDRSTVEAARDARTRDIAALQAGASLERATRRGAGAGKAPSLPQVDRRLGELKLQIVDLESKNPNDPRLPVLKKQAGELLEVLKASKDYGPIRGELAGAGIQRQIDTEVAAELDKWIYSVAGTKYRALARSKKPEDAAKADDLLAQQEEVIRKRKTALSNLPAGTPGARPAAPAGTARPAPPAGYDLDQK